MVDGFDDVPGGGVCDLKDFVAVDVARGVRVCGLALVEGPALVGLEDMELANAGVQRDALHEEPRHRDEGDNRQEHCLEKDAHRGKWAVFYIAAINERCCRARMILRWLFLFRAVAYGYYVAIDPEQQPTLTLYDGRAADWTGFAGALLDTSQAVRINARGMHFFDAHVHSPRPGTPCVRTPRGLCELADGSVVLPLGAPRVSTTEACERSRGRMLTPYYYDISACDIAEGMDVVWMDDMLYVDKHLALPTFLYVCVAVLVLGLVVSLGQNLTHLLGDPHAATYPVLTEVGCLVLVAVLLVSHDPWRVWVCGRDRTMFVYTVGYVVVYACRHGFELYGSTRSVYTFNMIVACLSLATARLYGSFETPYATVFLVLLMSRFFHKCMSKQFVLLLACDTVYIAFHYYWCFRPTFYDTNEAPVYLVGVLFITHRIGEWTSRQQEIAEVHHDRELVHGVFAKQAQMVAAPAAGHDARHNAALLKLFHGAMQGHLAQ